MAIREGRWDCATCGRVGNRGPEKHCAGCGHPRGDDVELYLPEDAPEIDNRAALDRALAGPDWNCEHCDGDNPAGYEHCTGCGAPRGESEKREVVDHHTPVSASSARPEPRKRVEAPAGRPSKERREELAREHRRRKKKGCGRRILVGLIVLATLVLLLSWCNRTHEAVATVTGFGWERTIEVEELVTVTEEALPSQVPAGARRTEAGASGGTHTVVERVQVGTERVKVGVRDLGNGFFEDVYEDRPVYELRRRQVPVRGPPSGGMVRYEIEKWVVAREVRTSGSDRSPRWPDLALEAGQRAGERSEALRVFFSDAEGETLRYRARDDADWRRFAVGQRWRVEATAMGSVRSLSPL
ncbi:MAG: zinc finger protein [Thermoanaerobaculia bacterium]|nr:zinc finger protein [Thermoanaerobaculia bacterium]